MPTYATTFGVAIHNALQAYNLCTWQRSCAGELLGTRHRWWQCSQTRTPNCKRNFRKSAMHGTRNAFLTHGTYTGHRLPYLSACDTQAVPGAFIAPGRTRTSLPPRPARLQYRPPPTATLEALRFAAGHPLTEPVSTSRAVTRNIRPHGFCCYTAGTGHCIH
jgi:hypothetical protein